jgi:hypothetical protein
MLKLIQSEPVMFQAVIQAMLGLLLSFEIPLTPHQIGSILVFTAAVLALWTRTQVTSHPNNPSLNGDIKQ